MILEQLWRIITLSGNNDLRQGTKMTDSTKQSFAEKILDSMVDENGHCGERGLSGKQFAILSKGLTLVERADRGGWVGAYSGVNFSEEIFDGTIGRYAVKLSCFHHFNDRYTVVSIDKWTDELPTFEDSEFVGEAGSRMETDVTYVGESSYVRETYDGCGYEVLHIYKFADADGNLLVWKTTCELGCKAGTRLKLRGTVKKHDTYKDIKQTVLTRCKKIEF